MSLNRTFARNLRQVRERKGLTQANLAELASIDRAYLGKIEAGLQNVTLAKVEQLARALEVDVRDLLTAEDAPLKRIKTGNRIVLLRRRK